MENTITKLKTTTEEINGRIDEAEDWISNLKYMGVGNTQSEQQKSKKKNFKNEKNKDSFRALRDNIKHNSICIIGMPEGEGREQGIENLSE